jgi:hypothetical protein
MPSARQYLSGNHSHFGRPGHGRVYRGSRKRLRRIKWYEHTSIEFWIFVLLLLLMVFVAIPWLIRHPPVHHHDFTSETIQ